MNICINCFCFIPLIKWNQVLLDHSRYVSNCVKWIYNVIYIYTHIFVSFITNMLVSENWACPASSICSWENDDNPLGGADAPGGPTEGIISPESSPDEDHYEVHRLLWLRAGKMEFTLHHIHVYRVNIKWASARVPPTPPSLGHNATAGFCFDMFLILFYLRSFRGGHA